MEKASLVAREEPYYKRRVREALEIEKRDKTLNKDDGLKINELWRPMINQIKRIYRLKYSKGEPGFKLEIRIQGLGSSLIDKVGA